MTKAELHHLVDELPDDAIDAASLLLKRVIVRQLDPQQVWVWTDEWQTKLNASLGDLQAGRVEQFSAGEKFLEAL